MPVLTRWRVISVLLVGILLVFCITLYAGQRNSGQNLNGLHLGDDMAACIKSNSAHDQNHQISLADLNQVSSICYNISLSQLQIELGAGRRDTLVFQRSENTQLLIMVICITVSGVTLAGLQLLASYKLALVDGRPLAEGGDFSINSKELAVKSSTVGVVILAISFAFFIVFVLSVYTIHDLGSNPDSKTSSDSGTGSQQIMTGPIPNTPIKLLPNGVSLLPGLGGITAPGKK